MAEVASGHRKETTRVGSFRERLRLCWGEDVLSKFRKCQPRNPVWFSDVWDCMRMKGSQLSRMIRAS